MIQLISSQINLKIHNKLTLKLFHLPSDFDITGGLFNKLGSLLNSGKRKSIFVKSHIRNLFEMAWVDGNFHDRELILLENIAKKNRLSHSDIRIIRENPSTIEARLPESATEKFHQFYNLIHMTVIDNHIHESELRLCNAFAAKFGYPKRRIEEIVSVIMSNIKYGNDHDNTLKRISWMLS